MEPAGCAPIPTLTTEQPKNVRALMEHSIPVPLAQVLPLVRLECIRILTILVSHAAQDVRFALIQLVLAQLVFLTTLKIQLIRRPVMLQVAGALSPWVLLNKILPFSVLTLHSVLLELCRHLMLVLPKSIGESKA